MRYATMSIFSFIVKHITKRLIFVFTFIACFSTLIFNLASATEYLCHSAVCSNSDGSPIAKYTATSSVDYTLTVTIGCSNPGQAVTNFAVSALKYGCADLEGMEVTPRNGLGNFTFKMDQSLDGCSGDDQASYALNKVRCQSENNRVYVQNTDNEVMLINGEDIPRQSGNAMTQVKTTANATVYVYYANDTSNPVCSFNTDSQGHIVYTSIENDPNANVACSANSTSYLFIDSSY